VKGAIKAVSEKRGQVETSARLQGEIGQIQGIEHKGYRNVVNITWRHERGPTELEFKGTVEDHREKQAGPRGNCAQHRAGTFYGQRESRGRHCLEMKDTRGLS